MDQIIPILSVKTRLFAHPLITELMYICYMLFFAYVSFCRKFSHDEFSVFSADKTRCHHKIRGMIDS